MTLAINIRGVWRVILVSCTRFNYSPDPGVKRQLMAAADGGAVWRQSAAGSGMASVGILFLYRWAVWSLGN